MSGRLVAFIRINMVLLFSRQMYILVSYLKLQLLLLAVSARKPYTRLLEI